jgi:hypothetical protein
MKMRKSLLPVSAALLASLSWFPAFADAGKVVIGDIDDMSGLYADIGSPGAVEATKMAIADFGGSALGQPIELLTADHQNKPDVGVQKFREWADRNGLTMVSAAQIPASTSLFPPPTKRRGFHSLPSALREPRLEVRTARPTPCIMPMTRLRSATALRRRSSTKAARHGSS